MNFIKSLPSQLILNDFLSGKVLPMDQSQRIVRSILVDSHVDYESEMVDAKKFLTKMADTVVTSTIVSVKSEHEMSDVTKLLMVRFINIVYKGARPIVINDEVVYLPKTLEGFDEAKVVDYVMDCMRFVKHPGVVKADAVPVMVTPMPTKTTFTKKITYRVPNRFVTKESATV